VKKNVKISVQLPKSSPKNKVAFLEHDVYTFSGALAPWRNFAWCKVHFTCKSCTLDSPILAALLHGTPAEGVSQTLRCGKGMRLRNFRTGRHLCSAGRPSRWASAHFLVYTTFYLLLYV